MKLELKPDMLRIQNLCSRMSIRVFSLFVENRKRRIKNKKKVQVNLFLFFKLVNLKIVQKVVEFSPNYCFQYAFYYILKIVVSFDSIDWDSYLTVYLFSDLFVEQELDQEFQFFLLKLHDL